MINRTRTTWNLQQYITRHQKQMSYPLDEDHLVINLKTGYDVKRVFIIHGDPFDAGILGGNERWTGQREEIIYKKRLPHQIWWTTTLMPPYKRCKYYFELHTEEGIWYYFEDGFLTEEQVNMPGRLLQYFIVPWMNPADVNRTPSWVNDTVWYQIFPDRFCNGTPDREERQYTSMADRSCDESGEIRRRSWRASGRRFPI